MEGCIRCYKNDFRVECHKLTCFRFVCVLEYHATRILRLAVGSGAAACVEQSRGSGHAHVDRRRAAERGAQRSRGNVESRLAQHAALQRAPCVEGSELRELVARLDNEPGLDDLISGT